MKKGKERGITVSTNSKQKSPPKKKAPVTSMKQQESDFQAKQRNAPGIEGVLNRVALSVKPLYDRAEKFLSKIKHPYSQTFKMANEMSKEKSLKQKSK